MDDCLDQGGRWNSAAETCEFDDSICPGVPSNFDAELAQAGDKTLLAVFWAPWSAPDRLLLETLDREIATEPDRWSVRRINVDEEPDIAEGCRVRAVPTIIPFESGRPVDRLVGAVSSQSLREFLEKERPE